MDYREVFCCGHCKSGSKPGKSVPRHESGYGGYVDVVKSKGLGDANLLHCWWITQITPKLWIIKSHDKEQKNTQNFPPEVQDK